MEPTEADKCTETRADNADATVAGDPDKQLQKVVLHPKLEFYLASQPVSSEQIRSKPEEVRRELSFTARFSPEELKDSGDKPRDLFDEEFIVVQGMADLVVLMPEEIWLLDFKTDHFPEAELPDKVKLYGPQLQLYALALSRTYRRPVSQVHLYFLGHKP